MHAVVIEDNKILFHFFAFIGEGARRPQ
jgi:hypothetical protein